MKDLIEKLKETVVQIATPFSTGTGFYLKNEDLLVTNAHVVHGNSDVTIVGPTFKRGLAKVIYLDEKFDLAFLKPYKPLDLPEMNYNVDFFPKEGDRILIGGHPFGMEFTASQGTISNVNYSYHNLDYLQLDAALNPGNSGGPLLNDRGDIIGINTFMVEKGNNIGFSLPVKYLKKSIEEFKQDEREGARCISCVNIVFEGEAKNGYCPHCGDEIELPSDAKVYEPTGIPKIIESIITDLDYEVRVSRKGPNNWMIERGSAQIFISYFEKAGLISGDAHLCLLPKENIEPLYIFLLRQNAELDGLTFSVKDQNIVLSLMIYDRYLNKETGMNLLEKLFDKADHFDDILVNEYGAIWKPTQ